MKPLKVLDLFSGIGGFSLGLEATGGFETVAFCEINEFCQRVLKKHWPDVPILSDIKGLLGRDYKSEVDVICGGFPCQDISLAGASHGVNTGLKGERSGLWFEYKRVIKEVGPRFVIIENVTALRSNGLSRVLQDLWEVGYDAEWHCIPTSRLGSLQRRDRIWIIAHPHCKRKQRFLTPRSFSETGQRWACSKEDLQAIYDNPFEGTRWPQPLVCGSRSRFPCWVDRIKALGNSVDPRVTQMIGNSILNTVKNGDSND